MANMTSVDGEDQGKLVEAPEISVYQSARIEGMKESRSEFSSEVEFEIENSKVHWSELDPTTVDIEHDTEHYSPEANREHFAMLQKHPKWGHFFGEIPHLVVGEKIGEGAQADIYEANLVNEDGSIWCTPPLPPSEALALKAAQELIEEGVKQRLSGGRRPVSLYDGFVLKVFKEGCALQSLKKQWPPGMVSGALRSKSGPIRTIYANCGPLGMIFRGVLLKDERLKDRFAFVMLRAWGDLRKFIDRKMLQNNNQGPPFIESIHAELVMQMIAMDMDFLHRKSNILHKDLKASNVLVLDCGVDDVFQPVVADYECSVGVVGTGFWRAPEILKQLKNRKSTSSFILKFTRKADVYSYGMTCYEIVTGRIPFEGHSVNDYDLVLSGQRPELPHDLDPLVKDIITSCWHADPSQRPSFRSIVQKLAGNSKSGCACWGRS